jgi:hypothetical protein
MSEIPDLPPDPSTDPTRLTNQPSLTTSSGRIWLIVGGLVTGVAIGVLTPMLAFPPPGVALVAIILDVALYLAMIIARVTAPPGRPRLAVMAIALLAIAAVSLAAVITIAFSV